MLEAPFARRASRLWSPLSSSGLKPTAIIATALLAACNSPPDGPSPPGEFVVSPARQWSGGELRITSTCLRDRPVVRVSVDSATIASVRADDTTLVLQLPPGPSGAVIVRVDAWEAGRVSRIGYRDSRTYQGGWISAIHQFPQGPVGLGLSDPGGREMQGVWNLSTETGFQFLPRFRSSGYGPGPSYRGLTVAVFQDTTGMIGEWDLWPTLRFVDTVRGVTTHQRLTAVIGPEHYLLAFGNGLTGRFQGASKLYTPDDVTRGFISTTAGRALVDGKAARVPVFDIVAGDSAYTLPLRSIHGAAFSREGARLYLSGTYGFGQPSVLLTVDPADGSVVAEDTLPPGTDGFDLALDLSESLLFLLARVDSAPSLLVLDTRTLRRIGVLTVPAEQHGICEIDCLSYRIGIDESRRTVYLTAPGYPIVVHRFDLLR